MKRDIEAIWNKIPLNKRQSLQQEGFDEKYLKELLEFRPSENNPDFDMNSVTRQALGIDFYVPQINVSASAAARMGSCDIVVIPPRTIKPLPPIRFTKRKK